MAADSPSQPVFSWQFIVMIAATLGIVMNQTGGLPLSPANDRKPSRARGSEGIAMRTDSRLWADPYGALPTRGSANGKSVKDPGDAPMNLGAPSVSDSVLSRIKDGRMCLMPVIVRGDSTSPEAREMRTRFRFVTASGLGANGLLPDDPNHLMWVRIKLVDGQAETVPVEWFLPGPLSRIRRSPYEAVLVVWLRDSVLFTYPLEQLQWIRSQLIVQLDGCWLIGKTQPDFRVIGPYWSGTLVDMLNGDLKRGKGITFYSSTATMADGMLDLFAPKKNANGPTGRDRMCDPETGPVLVNLTCTDEQLSDSLIGELELRGVKPGDKDSRIAIISDWDTDYGRALPLTFAAKYKHWNSAAPADRRYRVRLRSDDYQALKSDDASSWPPQILRAYYLSGVEGNLNADDNQEKSSSDEAKTAPGSNSTAISLQRAEGEHQIDYIARLGRIFSQRIDERNKEAGDNGKLVAIGVLGADVYDKLLLIQALRPIFKGAVFFTDALDARFMDPVKAIPYTRNLVISASYGFELFRGFQVGALPFRSTEQTGAFLAVQTAVAGDGIDLKHLTSQLIPLRFELGRTYPVPLDIPGAPRLKDCKLDLRQPVDKFAGLLHPPQEKFFPDFARIRALYLRPAILLTICAVLLWFAVMFVLNGCFPFSLWKTRRTWVIVASVVGCSALLAAICHLYDGIEPATWIQGVSIWPSEFVRILAFATGFVGLLVCHSKVRKSRNNLAVQFGITPPDVVTERYPKKFWMAISRTKQAVSEYLCTFAEAARKHRWLAEAAGASPDSIAAEAAAKSKDGREPEEYIVFEELWRDACERSTAFGRNARTAAMTLLFLLAMACLFGATRNGELRVPYRGDFSRICDFVALFLSSLMLMYLMFWVVDETHTCLRFIKKLGARQLTIWPQRTYYVLPSLRPFISRHGITGNAASSYLDVCFIGKLSREAVPLIILPFIVLTLIIISRWNLFANWRWEAVILAAYGIDSAICIFCAVRLRNAAVAAKARSIKQITRAASDARAAGDSAKGDSLDALRELMVDNMDGAFVPWHQQPFVSALLIPFGGTSGLAIVEYLLSRS